MCVCMHVENDIYICIILNNFKKKTLFQSKHFSLEHIKTKQLDVSAFFFWLLKVANSVGPTTTTCFLPGKRFAQLKLSSFYRQGNTTCPQLSAAELQTLEKNPGLLSTSPSLSAVGHLLPAILILHVIYTLFYFIIKNAVPFHFPLQYLTNNITSLL